jgi:hypothetical protein
MEIGLGPIGVAKTTVVFSVSIAAHYNLGALRHFFGVKYEVLGALESLGGSPKNGKRTPF